MRCRKSFFLIWFAGFSVILDAQTIPLSNGVRTAAAQILSNDTCKFWPPILVKPQDSGKSPEKLTPKQQAAIQKTEDDFVGWLDKTLQVDTSQQAISYAGSFLRLLDTPRADDNITSFPKSDDADLMGLSRVADSQALSIWGTTRVAIRHDCQSLSSAYANASSGFTLPTYSAKGGFTLSSNAQNDQTANFLLTTTESPFDSMYNDQSSDHFRKLHSSLVAAEWVARNPNRTHYIRHATLLSIESLSSSNDSTSMLANASLGANFPFFSASAEAKTQITRDLESSVHSFQTLLYAGPDNIVPGSLPSLSSLLLTAKTNFSRFPAPTNPVIPGVAQQATIAEEGWPDSLCKDNAWTIGARNTLYESLNITFQPKAANSAGYPSCSITVTYTLNNSDATQQVLTANQSAMSDPQLVITDVSASTVTLDLPFDKPLQLAGKPQVDLTQMNVNWESFPATSPSVLAWTLKGLVTLPDLGATVTGYSLDPGSFKCIPMAGTSSSPVPIQVTFAPTPVSADTLATPQTSITTSATSFALVLSVNPQSVSPAYDPSPAPNLAKCIISGTLNVQTSEAGTTQRTKKTLTSNPVNFPNQLSGTTVTAVVCDSKRNSAGNYLLASATANGMTCTLVGSGLQTIKTISLRSKSNPAALPIGTQAVAATNGGAIAITVFDPAFMKTLTESTYTLMMTDSTTNVISSLATDLAIVPLPAVTAAPNSIATAATTAGFSFALQGTSLDQIVQIKIKPQNTLTTTATATAVTNATSVAATFPAGTIPAGTYELYAVIDSTLKLEFDMGKALVITN
jgi:hypothetical protein